MWWKDLVRRFLPVTAEHTNPFYGRFDYWLVSRNDKTGVHFLYDWDGRYAIALEPGKRLRDYEGVTFTISKSKSEGPLPFMAVLTRREQLLATREIRRMLNERAKQDINARAVAAAITK